MAQNLIEPTVIDEEVLLKAVNEQVSGDAAEIARKEGIDFNEVLSLRLDYKNILKIDYLWQFKSLTKLQLDNNIIEKIENIGHLRNLKWLDLSFNNISVIEGLDGLTKLTDLSLFNNRITQLENMDSLIHLNVLSIGNNLIQDIQQISYLSRFDKLRLLNASGNPICRDQEYKNFVLSRLKNLKYLDYRLIEQSAINTAREIYIDDIIAIEEEQKILAKQMEEQRFVTKLKTKYAKVYLPNMDLFLTHLFDLDSDYQKLLLFAKEPLLELQHQFKEKAQPLISNCIQEVLHQHQFRKVDYAQFQSCIQASIQSMDLEGQLYLKAFQKKKKQQLKMISSSHNMKSLTHNVEDFRLLNQDLLDQFLSMELTLVEQFEDLNKEFERNYTDACNSIKETVCSCFAKLREYENEHHEKLHDAVLLAFEKQSKMDLEDLDDALRDLLRDKDAVTNHITGSHDYRISKMDTQEEIFTSGINDELEKTIHQVHLNELKRDRRRVHDIILFHERCTQECEMAEELANG